MVSRIEVRSSVATCTQCSLHNSCSGGIPFNGDSPNDIVVVGEAPGSQEDKERKPFIGPSGRLLRSWLEEVGINEDKTPAYLNAVSCFPHRTPRYSEVSACRNNLWQQLQVVKPKYILIVGSVAISSWWKDIGVTEIRGGFWQAYWVNNHPEERELGNGWSWAFATYHPAAVLRNRGLESQTKSDIKHFSEVVLGKVDLNLLLNCVKCQSEEVEYVTWGVPYCWYCWPENRSEFGAGKLREHYTVKDGIVPPFMSVGVVHNGKWVKEVEVQGSLL